MKKKIVSIVFLIICIFVVKQEAYATDSIAFWQPYPKDITVLVNQPIVSMKLILNENIIETMTMTINDVEVNVNYDSENEQIYYMPTSPLEAGVYRVDVKVAFQDWDQSLENSWQFSIASDIEEQAIAYSEEQLEALIEINQFRQANGLEELVFNKNLTASANAHAIYMNANNIDISSIEEASEEIEKENYTGKTPTTRARVQGYNGILINEKSIRSSASVSDVVEQMLNSPYMKIMLLDAHIKDFGYATNGSYHTLNVGRIETTENILSVYPHNGATDIDTHWISLEKETIDFEISNSQTGNLIILSYYTDIELENIEVNQLQITNMSGQDITYNLKSQLNDERLAASVVAIPDEKLEANTTYIIDSQLTINYYTQPSVTIPYQSVFTTGETQESYKDTKGHWAEETIQRLTLKDIIEEREEGLYFPDEMITRGEFCKAIIKLLDIEISEPMDLFIDVEENNPLRPYIEAAKEHNLLNGYPDQSFKPENLITRQELAVIIEKLYLYKFTEIDDTDFEEIKFLDQEDIQNWALNSVEIAYNLEIIKGRQDGNYYPNENATRGEAAVILERILKIIEDDYKTQ